MFEIIKHTQRVHNTVLMFCYAAKHRDLATVYDLEKLICEKLKVSDFAQLQVGPLCAYPEIRKLFGLADGVTKTPHVTGDKVVASMFAFVRKKKRRIESPKDFKNWFASKEWLDVRKLGIHLKGRGILGIFRANKVLRNHQKKMEQREQQSRQIELDQQRERIRDRLAKDSRADSAKGM